ncbi:Xaa-Pro aminopeptidase/Xaa-Pro dipeptidase [Anaerosolibacter carboniphilus]|uniref:Xaa-Pro aminopeptidase/Xaa-Pro dipeptidase n=1 Tax=Anaerosolibacter carboniphilus TaxID=1417629 RepID=A0A841KUD1_9FIRM|nr:M24 family metallopeptidase [Anaerosolibacter carboniphilus]MBB6217314.1 Xaa-Pro aminopeptidase/Xaa-Pro dipeptidase [Anaerosolibacter carboniphilus]
MTKLSNLRKLLEINELDAILIASPYNKFYLANLYSGSGYVFVTNKSQYVIVDARYYAQVKENAKDFIVIETSKINTLENILNRIIREEDIQKLGFEGEHITFDTFFCLNMQLQALMISISLKSLRSLKSEAEIKMIEEAALIGDKVYSHILEYIEPGMSERQVENELVRMIKECGGKKESFDIIVASGERGAFPHGKASDKIIQTGEFVTIDFGVNFNNYCSDMTRTFAMGYVKDRQLKEIYEVVRKAQEAAVQNIRAGVTAGEIDAIARNIIKEAGWGEYFGHNLGHGIGIMVHEHPDLSPGSPVVLEEGMVVTVEPGVYIPSIGGVRIEDDVLVNKNSCVVLTKSSRDLMIVKG